MPWKETCAMDERVEFLAEYLRGEDSIASLCRIYGISRPTGYKWIKRYEEEGPKGLEEKSRAPLEHPNALPAEIEDLIIELRTGKMVPEGPRKIRARLERDYAEMGRIPSASTLGEVLRRYG